MPLSHTPDSPFSEEEEARIRKLIRNEAENLPMVLQTKDQISAGVMSHIFAARHWSLVLSGGYAGLVNVDEPFTVKHGRGMLFLYSLTGYRGAVGGPEQFPLEINGTSTLLLPGSARPAEYFFNAANDHRMYNLGYWVPTPGYLSPGTHRFSFMSPSATGVFDANDTVNLLIMEFPA